MAGLDVRLDVLKHIMEARSTSQIGGKITMFLIYLICYNMHAFVSKTIYELLELALILQRKWLMICKVQSKSQLFLIAIIFQSTVHVLYF